MRINAPAVVFAIAVAILTSLVFGFAPALSASQIRPTRRTRSAGRLRGMLVVSEVALSVVLLAGAGLLLRSYARLWQTNPGFVPDRLLTARISLPPLQYSDPSRITAFYAELLAGVRALAGQRRPGRAP